MKVYKTYSEKEIVACLTYLNNNHTIKEACQQFNVKDYNIYGWIAKMREINRPIKYKRSPKSNFEWMEIARKVHGK